MIVKKNADYIDYELGDEPTGKWGLSICDLRTGGKAHFHKKFDSHFIVLEGRVRVVRDGISKIYSAGDYIHVSKGVVHEFESVPKNQPVRLLCVEMPLGEPHNVHHPY